MQACKNAKEHYINVAQRSSASGQERYINVHSVAVQECKNAKERYNNVAQRSCARAQERYINVAQSRCASVQEC